MTRRRRLWLVVVPSASYLLATLVLCLLVGRLTDRFWVATVLAFAPRWPLLLPAVVLLPLTLWAKERAWAGAVATAALLAAVGYMGFVLPSPGGTSSDAGRELVVVSYNIKGSHADDAWVARFVAASDADLIALQECIHHPEEGRELPPGYEVAYSHSHCLLSRFPIREVDARDQRDAWAKNGNAAIVRFEVDVEGRTIRVVTVHLETVREGLVALRHRFFAGVPALQDNIALRRWESQLARKWSERGEGPLLVVGDFNLPVESVIYRDSWSHLVNAFDECGWGYGHSKRTRWYGIRIDHILMGDAWRCEDAELGDPGRSDHAPLIARLRLR